MLNKEEEKEENEIVQAQLINLVKEIQQGEGGLLICEMTESFLYNIHCVYNAIETHPFVSLLFRLIYHTKNPEIAFYMLKGILNFAQSKDGMKYKPMFDHYFIETYDWLVKTYGWSFLKQFMIILRDNLENGKNEMLFHHIITNIVNQLRADDTATIENISYLCYQLPREKSFTWGWLTYYIAHVYGNKPNNLHTIVSAKHMRQYLMYYRRLLTSLRRRVVLYDDVVTTRGTETTTVAGAEEAAQWEGEINWETLVNTLQVQTQVEAPVQTPVEAQTQTEQAHIETPVEAQTQVEQTQTPVEAQAEPVQTPVEAQAKPVQTQSEQAQIETPVQTQVETQAQTQAEPSEEKKPQSGLGSWLYSWFG